MKLFRQLKIFKDSARKDGLVVITKPYISGAVTCCTLLESGSKLSLHYRVCVTERVLLCDAMDTWLKLF